MIDTDKYEGHAKEGWHFDSANVLRDGYDKEIAELVGEDWLDDKATQKLIADAPLLLAEVKRLRDELVLYEKYDICHPDGTHCCDECLERNGFEVKKNEHLCP